MNSNSVTMGKPDPFPGVSTSSSRLISPAEFNESHTSLILAQYVAARVSLIIDCHLIIAFEFITVKKE